MTLIARFVALFPAVHLCAIAAQVILFAMHPNVGTFFGIIAAVYVLPIAMFRIHEFFYPVKYGLMPLDTKDYVPWWGAYQIQSIFIAAPFLEGLLRLIPGLYSVWLRCWGAKVGKKVFWSPSVSILDRSMIKIGDYAIFGHQAQCISHYIRNRAGHLEIFVGPITIGDGCLIGGGVILSAATTIGDGAKINAGTTIYPHIDVPAEKSIRGHKIVVTEKDLPAVYLPAGV